MPQAVFDDLDAFLATDEFAVSATVHLQDGGTRVITGIFDDPYLNTELGEYEVDTSRPRFACKQADVINLSRGDTVEIDGETFDIITSAQPDGTGMALLELARQPE